MENTFSLQPERIGSSEGKMAFLSKIFKSIIVIVFVLGCSSSEDVQKEEKVDIRKKSSEIRAPDFISKDLQGKKVSLSDYKGRDVLLVFGATWCRYCRKEIPHLKELYSKYREKGFEILNIYTQESKEKVSSFVNKHEISYKVVLDQEGNVARQYGIRGVPTHCLVSRDGMILCYACRNVGVLLGMLFDDNAIE